MHEDNEYWRWNVEDTWLNYSSMIQEMFHVNESTSDLERYHHLSGFLLFAGCAVEFFLNKKMRIKLENEGVEESLIFKRLRYPDLKEKLKKWPQEFCGTQIPKEVQETILKFGGLRNEVKHRKRRDHSLYRELDQANPSIIVAAVQEALLTVHEAEHEAFPYWLFGWNYVGMNSDPTHPLLINNQQFRHSLRNMGFPVPAWDYGAANAWEKEFMTTRQGFSWLRNEIYEKAPDIEPKQTRFPLAPRLCKRWWDKEFIRISY